MKILDKTIKKTSTLFYLILNQIFLYLQIFLFFFHEQLIKKKKDDRYFPFLFESIQDNLVIAISIKIINIFNLSENILFKESFQNFIHSTILCK